MSLERVVHTCAMCMAKTLNTIGSRRVRIFERERGSMEPEKPLLIAIPLYHQFTALDAIGPYEVLHLLPNVSVQFVSHSPGLISAGSGALSLLTVASFHDVPHPDVIVVPGGSGTFAALEDEAFLDWIKQAHKTTLYTTSVCTGSIILAAAGLLDGLEATTHWHFYEELSKRGAMPTEKRIVQQGKIITAAGVSAGIDMAIKLASFLRGEEMAKVVQLLIEYDPQPPYNVGAPSKAGEELVQKTANYTLSLMESTRALKKENGSG